MTINVKNILTLLLIIAFSVVKGQHCSMTADMASPVSLRIKSQEITSLTGQVTIQVVVKAKRRIYFPSLPYLDGQFSASLFSEEPNNNSYAAPDTLEVGDSLMYSITLSYDQNNLPYYPADVVLAFNDSLKRKAKLYFTPYGTLEVWDIGDYTTLNRTWIDPTSVETTPTRISVSQSSIPVSDLPSSGEIADDVAIYTVNVPGLAYSIPMLQPDTFNWDTGVFYSPGGNSKYKADGCGFWGHRFNGRISNLRLTSLHIPDGLTFNVADAVDIGLRDLEVDICVNRWPNQVVMECTTDDEGFLVDGNGNRTIDFDFCTGSGRDEIGVFLRVRTRHPTNKSEFKVKFKGGVRGFHEFQSPSIIINYNNSNRTTLNFGTNAGNGVRRWNVDLIDLGKVYSILRWAWHYGYLSTAGNHKRNLKVLVDTDLEDNKAFYRRNTNNLYFAMNLIDDIVNRRDMVEFVYYHEFGHFFMYGIIGDDKWTRPSGISSEHSGNFNNFSDNMTMSEGTANGFAFILDEMTANVTDGESGRGWIAYNYHAREVLNANLNTPFLSERVLARIMLDMWDGTGNNAAFGNPIGVDEEEDYFDDLSNGNGPQDNIELSFNTILSPFWENVGNVNDLPTYFDRLVEKLDCQGKKDLKRLWLHNFSDHLVGANPRVGVNPDNFMFLNTDEIAERIDVTYVGNEMKDKKVVSTNTINQTFTADVTLIDNDEFSILPLVGPPVNGVFNTWDVSDPLEVLNDGVLSFNATNLDGFISTSNGPFNVLNTISETIVCDDIDVSDGDVIVGSSVVTSGQNAFVKLIGSELSMSSVSPSRLVINNNSSLIIEPGATLRIGPGTQVILDGPNAILEI